MDIKRFKGVKNVLLILLILSLVVTALVGCSDDNEVENPDTDGYTFTD